MRDTAQRAHVEAIYGPAVASNLAPTLINGGPRKPEAGLERAAPRGAGERFFVTVRLCDGESAGETHSIPVCTSDTAITLRMRASLHAKRDLNDCRVETAGSVLDGPLTLADVGVEEGAQLLFFRGEEGGGLPALGVSSETDDQLANAFLEAIMFE